MSDHDVIKGISYLY